MAEIDVPLVDREVDTSEPTSAVMTIAMLVAGFAIFIMTQQIGGYVASRVNSALTSVFGFNPATGSSPSESTPDLI